MQQVNKVSKEAERNGYPAFVENLSGLHTFTDIQFESNLYGMQDGIYLTMKSHRNLDECLELI